MPSLTLVPLRLRRTGRGRLLDRLDSLRGQSALGRLPVSVFRRPARLALPTLFASGPCRFPA